MQKWFDEESKQELQTKNKVRLQIGLNVRAETQM